MQQSKAEIMRRKDTEKGDQMKEDRPTVKVKKLVKVREMRAGKGNSLPTGSLPQQ